MRKDEYNTRCHRFRIIRRLITDLLHDKKPCERTLYRLRNMIDDWANDDLDVVMQLPYRSRRKMYFDYTDMRWKQSKNSTKL